MTIATTLQDYLQYKQVNYELMTHAHTGCSAETAAQARIPSKQLAKSVILGDDLGGYLMAVVPANRQVVVHQLSQWLGRSLHLASEKEVARLFADCEPGAIPPVGTAYDLQMVLDEALAAEPEVYFEAGDHEELVHMRIDDFLDIMDEADRISFARLM